MKDLRIVFMGTPDFSVPVLEGLIDFGYQVVLVVTQPDKEVGRKREISFSPIKRKAIEKGIPLFQPERIRNDYQPILDMNPDIIVTCAYGQIVPNAILDFPKYGCINVHASLLPKLRGGAPIHHAIMDGYVRTGVTIMMMAPKMDAGDILTQKDTVILDSDNLETLHDRLSLLGRDLLLETLPSYVKGEIVPIPQKEEEVSYAWNIKREEEKLDFNRRTREVFNHIRGLSPHPCAYCYLDGKVLKLYQVSISDRFYNQKAPGTISRIEKEAFGIATLDGEIMVREIQLEGKKRMMVKDYFNGIDPTSLLGKVLK